LAVCIIIPPMVSEQILLYFCHIQLPGSESSVLKEEQRRL